MKIRIRSRIIRFLCSSIFFFLFDISLFCTTRWPGLQDAYVSARFIRKRRVRASDVNFEIEIPFYARVGSVNVDWLKAGQLFASLLIQIRVTAVRVRRWAINSGGGFFRWYKVTNRGVWDCLRIQPYSACTISFTAHFGERCLIWRSEMRKKQRT